MHCIDEHGVPDPSMTEIQVSNSTVLCKLLVRGWTVKLVNFNITKYRLTSSDSVAFECKDNSSDAYTVTISENKTYVSQTNQKTVTVPFVCLPEEYTDDRTKLSESVITMQLLSVGGGGGGGGGSTSGSVTLKADDFNRAVLEFKNQVQLLSTVINQSNQSTTSAATTAADASQVAVATAAESAQSSSSTDNAVVQALNAVKEKLAALEVPQATIQNADNVSGLVKSLDGHISRLFAEMDQHNRRLLADFDARNKKLVQTILAASSHGPSTVPRAPPADEPSRQSTYSGSPKRVPKTTLSDGTEPIPNLKSLAKELEKVIAQSNTTTSNSFPPKTVSNTHILKGLHEYIIHDPFYRRKTLGCSYVFTPSQAEWRKSKNTKKVCVMVSTYVAQRDDNHQRLLNNLSTLSMLIVQIFPKTSIQNYPRVYVCDYDLTRQYNVVKDLKPQNDVTNPSNGFDFDFAMRLFEMRNTTEVFKDCFLETVPHFKTLFEQNGQTPESNFIQSLLPNDNIAFVKSKLNNKLRSNDTTSPYYKYMLGLKYEIQKFEEIQQAQTNNFSKLQNVRYFADSLPNDTKRAYLDEAIQQTIDKLRARSIGPPPVAPAPPAGDPPGAVAEASARSIGPLSLDDLPGPVGSKRAYSLEPNEKHNWQLGYNLYHQPVAKPFKPMLKRCSAYEQFLIVEHLRTFYEIIGGKNKSKEVLKPSFEYALWFGATIMNDASVDALCEVYKNYETNAVDVATIRQVYTQFQTKIIKEYNADEQRKSNADIIRQQYETGKTRDAGAYMQSAMRKIRQNVEHEKARLASMIAQDDHWDHIMEEDTRTAVSFLEDTDEIDSIDNIGLMGICQKLLQEYNNRNTDEKTRRFILVRYKHALLHYKYDHF